MSERNTGHKMSRRDFVALVTQAGISGGTVLAAGGLATAVGSREQQTPEASPTPDPYAETDAANIRTINSVNTEGDFTLTDPRIIAIGKLDTRFLPDVTFGIIADHEDKFYALVRNIDECLIPQLENGRFLGEKQNIEPQGLLRKIVRNIEIWPTDIRPESMIASVMLNKKTVEELVNNVEEDIPTVSLLVAKSVHFGEKPEFCPTLKNKLSERAGGLLDRLGRLTESAQGQLSDIQWSELVYGLGVTIGDTLESLESGYKEGRSR